MKKLSIIRFKPNPEHYGEFVKSLKHFISLPDRKGIVDSFIMTKDEEVHIYLHNLTLSHLFFVKSNVRRDYRVVV